MKINEGNGVNISRDMTQSQTRKPMGGEFQKIMDQAIQAGNAKGPASPGAVDPLLNGRQVFPAISIIDQQSALTESQQLINSLKETMDLVDFYAARLADPSRPLDTIDPLVGHLEQRLESLKEMESAPGLPDKLKPIISDLVITLGTEITRYKSGTYSNV